MVETAPYTHSAFVFKVEGLRKGFRRGRWINEGDARIEPDGSIFVYLHSTPIGGFDGRIRCFKIGTQPPEERLVPQRPRETNDDESDNDQD
jgi:hypothetical protein